MPAAVPLIDAHVHLFAPGQVAAREQLCARDATFAELYGDARTKLATAHDVPGALDKAGIDAAVAVGFAFAAQADIDAQAEYLLARAQEHPRRLLPVVSVNPALPGWERSATHALAAGAPGFGELRPGNQGWDPLGLPGRRLAALAREADAVLLWHVSEPTGHAYAGKHGGITPGDLAELATEFPGLRMVAAHLGGGLPFYLQMPEVHAALAAVWFDTAAASLLYDDAAIARVVELAGPARVLFGSDYPLLSPQRQLARVRSSLPAEVRDAVCGGNAAELYRRERV